jgi:hypothetical protein
MVAPFSPVSRCSPGNNEKTAQVARAALFTSAGDLLNRRFAVLEPSQCGPLRHAIRACSRAVSPVYVWPILAVKWAFLNEYPCHPTIRFAVFTLRLIGRSEKLDALAWIDVFEPHSKIFTVTCHFYHLRSAPFSF